MAQRVVVACTAHLRRTKEGRMSHQVRVAAVLTGVLMALIACASPAPRRAVVHPTATTELVLYNWAEYMPQSVLDDFAAEYGVKVTYLTYPSQEEAVRQIQDGLAYDIAVIENDLLPMMVASGLLAEIDHANVPNLKNISANFRDLAFDPGNRHSVPYMWGTSGLLVRSDLAQMPVTRWADLWDPRLGGAIVARNEPVELISVALKSLGYRLNTEEPAELEAAGERLAQLRPRLSFVDVEAERAIAPLLSGDAVAMIGWPGDALVAQSAQGAIAYILPAEGTMLWGDSLTISARSAHKEAAERFLNFVLRPEVSAQIVNAYSYATANEAAYPFIQPEILNNPIVFPPLDAIAKGEWYMPLSPEGKLLYDRAWERFMSAVPQETE
jgi:spermidine/putrescine transport system substrate-binding protein